MTFLTHSCQRRDNTGKRSSVLQLTARPGECHGDADSTRYESVFLPPARQACVKHGVA